MSDPKESAKQTQESGEIVKGLSQTAQTLGSSLQAMQSALVGNMQQASQMMQSMNHMMEELVRRSVQVHIFAKPSPSPGFNTHLNITIYNRSPVPLQNLTIGLTLTSRAPFTDASLSVDDTNGIFKCMQTACGSWDLQAKEGLLVKDGTLTSTLNVVLDKPSQLNGHISVQFASPGTKDPLQVNHRFGIQLLQLIPCSFACNSDAIEYADLKTVDQHQDVIGLDLNKAREVFAVPPSQGISKDSLLLLQFADDTLALQITGIAADKPTAQAKWLTTIQDSAIISLIPYLEQELE
ncbi:hypothetical protein EV183_001464 [Coemansia sp. RSA 2336]|nr:hypothetical protein EV183_001464 [Coemansia sp. RSA 2336]